MTPAPIPNHPQLVKIPKWKRKALQEWAEIQWRKTWARVLLALMLVFLLSAQTTKRGIDCGIETTGMIILAFVCGLISQIHHGPIRRRRR